MKRYAIVLLFLVLGAMSHIQAQEVTADRVAKLEERMNTIIANEKKLNQRIKRLLGEVQDLEEKIADAEGLDLDDKDDDEKDDDDDEMLQVK